MFEEGGLYFNEIFLEFEENFDTCKRIFKSWERIFHLKVRKMVLYKILRTIIALIKFSVSQVELVKRKIENIIKI